MALPSGYTRLDYIESSGTQYIDTGFKPNGNTQVDIKFKMVNQGTAQQSIFGARPGSSGRFTVFTGTNSAALQVDYGTESSLSSPDTAISGLSLNTMTELSMSNALVVNGTTVKTVSAVTFTSTYNLYLFANNNAGVVQLPSAMLLYSCKIYDNGTLVRDFIPCKNASGAIGLWDNVNSVFYANAGTGTFSTGKKHKVLINDTGYEIKSGRVLIVGTGYDIKKGRTLIGGTGYDISFGTPVGELAVGTIIKINESGSPIEFYVAKHNYESDLNGLGRTLVVRKNSYNTVYDECNKSFFTSSVYTLLNNTYFNLLDARIQSAIGTTKFKYTGKINDYSNESLYVSTGESAVFLLSATELGETSTEGKEDGSALLTANILKIAYYNGTADKQLTRTRSKASPGYLVHFEADGTLGNTIYEDVPYRPVFTLPAAAEVDSNFILIES